jgi:hypothetical protein
MSGETLIRSILSTDLRHVQVGTYSQRYEGGIRGLAISNIGIEIETVLV